MQLSKQKNQNKLREMEEPLKMLQVMNRFFLDKTEKNFNSIYMDLYNDLYDVSEKIIL